MVPNASIVSELISIQRSSLLAQETVDFFVVNADDSYEVLWPYTFLILAQVVDLLNATDFPIHACVCISVCGSSARYSVSVACVCSGRIPTPGRVILDEGWPCDSITPPNFILDGVFE
jgi:hypothetical protein